MVRCQLPNGQHKTLRAGNLYRIKHNAQQTLPRPSRTDENNS